MMHSEIGRLFGAFYIGTYLAAILIGIGCYMWHDEMIFLLGFGFFGCFMAARLAMGSVFAALSVPVAWLIAFVSTTLINCLLAGVLALGVYLTHRVVSVEIADNISGLLLGFQLFSAAFIFGGLKLHNYRLLSS